MLTQDQKIGLQFASAALIAHAGFTFAILKRSFDLENKAQALGEVVLNNVDKLSEADKKRLNVAGINI